jgi:hypothetical protein
VLQLSAVVAREYRFDWRNRELESLLHPHMPAIPDGHGRAATVMPEARYRSGGPNADSQTCRIAAVHPFRRALRRAALEPGLPLP